MSDKPTQTDEWTSCDRGEISGMLSREQFRRRRRFLAQAGGAAAVGVLGGIAFVKFAGGEKEKEKSIAGISCREVRGYAKVYLENRESLEADLRDRIATHVDDCGSCAKYLEKLKHTAKPS